MLFTITISITQADDWGSCANDLDSLRRAASYASDVAQSAESVKTEYENTKEEVEDKKRDLKNCLNLPDVYDYFGDRCDSRRREYNNAVDNFNSAKSDYVIAGVTHRGGQTFIFQLTSPYPSVIFLPREVKLVEMPEFTG